MEYKYNDCNRYTVKLMFGERQIYFFFQAEDGIRDTSVTGVQTCALPIWRGEPGWLEAQRRQPHPGAPMGAGENGATA